MKDTTQNRQSIIDACRYFRSNGYVFGTWGNISVRLDDGNILLTPSRVDYDEMCPEDLVVLAPDGTRIAGERLATSEREIHRRIMNARPDIGAIVHTHSPAAMACSAIEGGIPAFSEEMCQLLGGAIPLSERFVPSDAHEELGKTVAESLGQSNAILIRNHGPVALGKTLKEAIVTAQVVEKNASIYLSLLATGKRICVLDEEAVARGRDYFMNKYGKT